MQARFDGMLKSTAPRRAPCIIGQILIVLKFDLILNIQIVNRWRFIYQQRIILEDVSSEMHTFEKRIDFYHQKSNINAPPAPALTPQTKKICILLRY